MQYIQGNNRNQAVLFPKCLDELVDVDNVSIRPTPYCRLASF